MQWLKLFDERQQKEIEFSELYSKEFAHGTEGHNAKLVIAKMSNLLNLIEETVQIATLDDTEISKMVAKILNII